MRIIFHNILWTFFNFLIKLLKKTTYCYSVKYRPQRPNQVYQRDTIRWTSPGFEPGTSQRLATTQSLRNSAARGSSRLLSIYAFIYISISLFQYKMDILTIVWWIDLVREHAVPQSEEHASRSLYDRNQRRYNTRKLKRHAILSKVLNIH